MYRPMILSRYAIDAIILGSHEVGTEILTLYRKMMTRRKAPYAHQSCEYVRLGLEYVFAG